MQTPSPHEAWHLWHVVASASAGVFAGGTATKYLSKVVKAMPPLPPNATWMQKWGYATLQSITEAEPSQWDGKDRRGSK